MYRLSSLKSPKSTESWGIRLGNQSHCQLCDSIPAQSVYGEHPRGAYRLKLASFSSPSLEASSVLSPAGNSVLPCFASRSPGSQTRGLKPLFSFYVFLWWRSSRARPTEGIQLQAWAFFFFGTASKWEERQTARSGGSCVNGHSHYLCCLSVEKALETKWLLFSGLCGGSFMLSVVGANVKSNVNAESVC